MCSELTSNLLVLWTLLEKIKEREMTANQYIVYSIADERRSAYGTHVDHLYLLSMFTLRPTLKTSFKYFLSSSWNKLSSFSLSFKHTYTHTHTLCLSSSLPAEECLCQNGGVCVDINGTCECPSGYTGLYCQFGEYDMYNAIWCPAGALISVKTNIDLCKIHKCLQPEAIFPKLCEPVSQSLSPRSNPDTMQ